MKGQEKKHIGRREGWTYLGSENQNKEASCRRLEWDQNALVIYNVLGRILPQIHLI